METRSKRFPASNRESVPAYQYAKLGVLVFVVLLGACASQETRDAAVYNGLLAYLTDNRTSKFAVRAQSVPYEECKRFLDGPPRVSEAGPDLVELFGDYKKRNQVAVSVEKQLEAWNGKVRFISEDVVRDIREFDRDAYMDDSRRYFKSRIPEKSGFLGLSRPGFSRAGNSALVYYEFDCGPLCGVGAVAQLRRTETGWKVEFTHVEWES